MVKKATSKLEQRYTLVGDVFVVGSGDCGQLGLGQDVLEKEKPALLSYFSDKNIVGIFAGGLHNICLSQDGKLYSWGCNDQRALGRSGEETEPGPVEGLDGVKVVDVCCGDSQTFCLTEDGQVYGWGTFRDKTGIFGFAPGVKQQNTPALIPQLKNIVHISCGTNHAVAISADGKIYTWGVGEQNQLGRKITPRQIVESSLTPRPINFKPYKMSAKFKSVYCGAYHTFVVHENGTVFSFGLNNYGQLGQGSTDEDDIPQPVEGFSGTPVQVAGGEHHSMILDDQVGQVYVFGRGDSGQLGIGKKDAVTKAEKLELGCKAISISCGASFSLAVSDEDGNNLYAWGYGEMGQLANGSEDADEPFQLELKERQVLQCQGGGQHTLLLIKKKA
ncbi:regulator of chromosome condensation 1/beta-lactamase-inhibitor protein II [Gorgonomyces haynaldii]|nr:regulator of chromosome condensation 1/beta-lactamase-inhibitor protein II [Gorgonomyces haynaldii]